MKKAFGIALWIFAIAFTWEYILAIGIIVFLIALYGLFTAIF